MRVRRHKQNRWVGTLGIARMAGSTKPGTPHRHLIAVVIQDNVVYRLHATKGWRRERLSA